MKLNVNIEYASSDGLSSWYVGVGVFYLPTERRAT